MDSPMFFPEIFAYAGLLQMFLIFIMSLLSIYTMILAIRALKLYIKDHD